MTTFRVFEREWWNPFTRQVVHASSPMNQNTGVLQTELFTSQRLLSYIHLITASSLFWVKHAFTERNVVWFKLQWCHTRGRSFLFSILKTQGGAKSSLWNPVLDSSFSNLTFVHTSAFMIKVADLHYLLFHFIRQQYKKTSAVTAYKLCVDCKYGPFWIPILN